MKNLASLTLDILRDHPYVFMVAGFVLMVGFGLSKLATLLPH